MAVGEPKTMTMFQVIQHVIAKALRKPPGAVEARTKQHLINLGVTPADWNTTISEEEAQAMIARANPFRTVADLSKSQKQLRREFWLREQAHKLIKRTGGKHR